MKVLSGDGTAVAWCLWPILVAACGACGGAEGRPERAPRPVFRLKDIPLGPLRLDVGGSIRFRYEFRDGFNQQRYADQRGSDLRRDHFLLQRTRLDLDLHLGEEAHFFVQLQDARAHGSDFDRDDFNWRLYSCPFWNPLDLRQAYLEWLHIGGTPFGVKVGRQAIFYADNRIWGPGEWGNVGRYTWDAIKVIADTPLAEIHGIFANRIRYDPRSFDEHDSHLDAFGLYAMVKRLPCRLDLFWVGKRTRPEMVVDAKGSTLDLDTHTLGFHLDGKAQRWDYGATVAHQFGKRNGLDVSAWGGNLHLGYTFPHSWQPRLGVEFAYASGDSDPADDRFETFDGVFGAIDQVYGRINFFSWMNLQDYQLCFSCEPHPKARLSIDYHFFRLDESRDAWYWCSGKPARSDGGARLDPTGRSGRDLGQEVDVIATYKASEHLKLMAGYAHFFPGAFIERTGPSPDADWFFFQTLYTF